MDEITKEYDAIFQRIAKRTADYEARCEVIEYNRLVRRLEIIAEYDRTNYGTN